MKNILNNIVTSAKKNNNLNSMPVSKTSLLYIKKLYGPFLWMGFNCLKATEPLQGGKLLFTTKLAEITGDLGRIKG